MSETLCHCEGTTLMSWLCQLTWDTN